ncbi:response regulator [Pontibacter diazotrophicus]|uniref:Response regulator n=1 Tax=Pontibacter diazotrophicus TaxID=1400979 RepID=A0A3D8L6N6_9BACT|nr:response regulator [Pontibacter diazotrophicus]RDV13080.1 response regulator [Pontibacter diazotrophicus]
MQELGKVLLVDDDSTNNFLSARTLRQADAAAQLFEARNGNEALELIKKEALDFILLDVNMPVMDGFLFLEALQKLQGTPGFNAPVVVLLTTSESYLDSDKALHCPIVKGFLTKPLSQDHVSYLLSLAADKKRTCTAA